MAVAIVAVIALQKPSTNRSVATTAGPATTSSRSASSSTAPAPSRSTSSSTSTSPVASTSSAPSTDARTGSTAHSVPLVVLNNTTTSGLAAQAAKQFEAGGWTVTSFGNYTNDIASTCAYYDPNVTGAETAAAALMAQYPTIKRIKEKFPELPAGPIVVVLTPDYSPS